MRKKQVIKFLVIAVLVALFYSSGLQDYVSQKAILALLVHMGFFAPLGFMAIMSLTVVSP